MATTVMAFRRRRLGRNGLLEGPLISNPLLIFGPGTLSWQRASNRDDGLDVLRPSSSISVPGTFWWSSFFVELFVLDEFGESGWGRAEL